MSKRKTTYRRAGGRPFKPGPEASARAREAARARWAKKREADARAEQQRALEHARQVRPNLGFREPAPPRPPEPYDLVTELPAPRPAVADPPPPFTGVKL